MRGCPVLMLDLSIVPPDELDEYLHREMEKAGIDKNASTKYNVMTQVIQIGEFEDGIRDDSEG